MSTHREPQRGDLVAYRRGPKRGMPFGVCRGDVAGPSGKRLVEVALLKSGWGDRRHRGGRTHGRQRMAGHAARRRGPGAGCRQVVAVNVT